MLVVLTVTRQLYLFSNDGTLIHQTGFAIDGPGGDDLVAYHTHFMNVYGNPEKSFHNCIAVRGASVYILGTTHLLTSRLLPWKERIQVLRGAGDWMGALNMGMTFYDGHAHGVIDLPRSLDAVQEAIMPYLVELLLSYVDEVFSYISVAFCNQIEKVERQDDLRNESGSVHSEIKEQFTRVGGVAVEFCVHIRRTDILFDEIYSKFRAVKHRDTFLELLEPYILRDMLGSLPPEIMQALVEHYSSNGWLQRVEQCVLHMDISSLDFNQVVRLCREHGLFGALIYLFNKGLDDFKAPLEELLNVTRNSQGKDATGLGYRLLVYLKYCFSGLAFPPGHGTLPPMRLPSLRADLVRFLLENYEAGSPQPTSSLSSGGRYPNLYHLLQLDTEATLDVLRCAFVDDDSPKPDISSDNNSEVQKEQLLKQDATDESQNILVQNTVDALALMIETETLRDSAKIGDDGSAEAWPSKGDIGYVFEFIAQYIASGKAQVSKRVLSKILEYLTSQNDFSLSIPTHLPGILKGREKRVLALLEVVPDTDWNSSYVLTLCESAHFYQVCGLIHTMRRHYLEALDSYMKEVGEPIHTFLYINNMLEQLSNSELNEFQSAIMTRIPELLGLSREGTLLLVVNHFYKEMPHILSILRSHPERMFLYLKTVIEVHLSGTLDFSQLLKGPSLDGLMGRKVKAQPKDLEAYLERISDFPKRMRNNPVPVTDDMIELYVELLCRYERNSVLKFLETFDSYRVEHCLRLCQEHGIIDAAAFLLERVGDVGSALSLTLSGLNDKFTELDQELATSLKATRGRSSRIEHYNTILKTKEVDDIESILKACVGLCQRNTPRLQPDQSEMLWFKLLDSFCAPLIDSSTDNSSSKEGKLMPDTLGMLEDDESCTIRWKIGKSHKGAHILRKLFSLFIKEIVEGMIGFIPLPSIMSKLLTDNSGHEFGDFKLTILGMLGTYGFERRILDTAKSLIEDDSFYTMNLLKKGASHGYAPRSLMCCICSCALTKNTSSFRVRVFNCGHATHLECEFLDNESSRTGSPSGCPVCMPKTNAQKPRNKSALSDNSLFNKVPRPERSSLGSATLLPHDDSIENAYGLHQMSRFEILSNLGKDQKLAHVENMPQLRLAPPAVYHERIQKGPQPLSGGNGRGVTNPSRKLRDIKVKGTSLRFPLKTSIFGKEKMTR
ncbi:Vacuolar protein sorting-associated protein 8 homolog [Linum grandiflorum]